MNQNISVENDTTTVKNMTVQIQAKKQKKSFTYKNLNNLIIITHHQSISPYPKFNYQKKLESKYFGKT